MVALNPKEMQAYPQLCRKLFRQILTVLLSANRVKEFDCNAILEQYSIFLDHIPAMRSQKFEGFNVKIKIELINSSLHTCLSQNMASFLLLFSYFCFFHMDKPL